MPYRALICSAALLFVAGCSYHYEIIAVEKAGKVVFAPKDDMSTGCFSDFSITSPDGVVMWKLSVDRYLPPPCHSQFPMTYGVKPDGMTEDTKPNALKPGVLYKIQGWDGDSYSGQFRFRRTIVIENVQ